MIFLLYTGISALIIGDPCIDHLEIFPTSRKHRNILQLCTIDEAEWQGGGARWKRESALGKVGNVCSWWGGGGGGETQSWSRAGVGGVGGEEE